MHIETCGGKNIRQYSLGFNPMLSSKFLDFQTWRPWGWHIKRKYTGHKTSKLNGAPRYNCSLTLIARNKTGQTALVSSLRLCVNR